MYMQYWCPLHQDVVAGDANGVWWQFHEDCNREYHHYVVGDEHAVSMEIHPLDDPDYVYYVATCLCGFRSRKQAVRRAAIQLWWGHYKRAKGQVIKGVDADDK